MKLIFVKNLLMSSAEQNLIILSVQEKHRLFRRQWLYTRIGNNHQAIVFGVIINILPDISSALSALNITSASWIIR